MTGNRFLLGGHPGAARGAGAAMRSLTRWFGVTRSDEERDLDAEQARAEEIVGHVLRMQADTASKQRRPLCRGTHAKGVCVRAELEVLDVGAGRDPVLARRLANGIFATPGTYPATVRFANSDPCTKPDFKPDVRSLSFFVDLTRDGTDVPPFGVARQDFSMQNAATLPLNDACAFLATMKVLTASSPLKGLASLTFKDQLRVVRSLGLAQLQIRQTLRPYQKLRYWSIVPFRHGPTDVVKQSAIPHPENAACQLLRRHPDGLRNELVRHLNEDPSMSRFDIGLQFLDTSRMTYWGEAQDASFWIENASVEWKELEAPIHTVATLTLSAKGQIPDDASDAIYFNVKPACLA